MGSQRIDATEIKLLIKAFLSIWDLGGFGVKSMWCRKCRREKWFNPKWKVYGWFDIGVMECRDGIGAAPTRVQKSGLKHGGEMGTHLGK